jgi:hypothetical protein
MSELSDWIRKHKCIYDIQPVVEIEEGAATHLGYELNLHAELPVGDALTPEVGKDLDEIRDRLGEVLESLIGKYKRLQAQHSAHGMTRTILALGAIVGRRCRETIRQALTQITTHHVADWCRVHLGRTLQSRRHQAFPPEQNQHPKPLRNTPHF